MILECGQSTDGPALSRSEKGRQAIAVRFVGAGLGLP